MSMSRRAIVVSSATVLLAGVVYGYRWYRDVASAHEAIAQGVVQSIRKPRPVAPVKPEGWTRLHVGMSWEEVASLLGEAQSRKQYVSSPVGRPGVRERLEFWEYGYASSFGVPMPDERAHVVYFDATGRVQSFRTPIVGP